MNTIISRFLTPLTLSKLVDTTLYLPAFRDERRLSKELVGSTVTTDHRTMQRLLLMLCLAWERSEHTLYLEACGPYWNKIIKNLVIIKKIDAGGDDNCEFSLPCLMVILVNRCTWELLFQFCCWLHCRLILEIFCPLLQCK